MLDTRHPIAAEPRPVPIAPNRDDASDRKTVHAVPERRPVKTLERSINALESRLILLAPPNATIADTFRRVEVNPGRHALMLREMQRLRGGVYLNDGAIRHEQLDGDNSHRTPEDDKAWHLLMLNGQRQITACVWYLAHQATATFEDLRVRSCALASNEGWRSQLWRAIESELARARREGLGYAEIGGWAVDEQSRCTSQGLVLALAAYSLGRAFGGVLGLTTATVRHASSTILRRLGGDALSFGEGIIPPYFDAHYGCDMELLRFDSRRPNSRYSELVELLRRKFSDVAVVATQPAIKLPRLARPHLVHHRYDHAELAVGAA